MRIILFLALLWYTNYSFANLIKPQPNIMPEEVINIQLNALKDNNRSVRMISILDITVESVVELMVKLILEVLVVAELIEVDPYTQNSVEKIKINVSKRLKNI